MQAWADLHDLALQPWEVDVLRRLDSLWRAAWAKGRPADRTPNSKKT